MEYKINNFNLSDINLTDQASLATYLETSVKDQKIKNLLLGPNVLNFKYSTENKSQQEESRKIINTLSRLIMYNLSSKEQTVVLQSNSNYSSKSYIKKIFKELESLINEKVNIDNKQEVFQSFLFFDFLTFFTGIKDDLNDEISICDYIIEFTYSEGDLIFNLIDTLHENSEFIYEKANNINNLHIFYMIIYNLPVEDLKCYLISDKTKDYFNIFSDEIVVDEFIKRYIFLNQFGILKNPKQFNEFSKSESNVSLIKKESDFYKNMYQNYLQIKEMLGIDDENERKIFELFFAMLLLTEYDILYDNFTQDMIEKLSMNPISQSEIGSIIKNSIFTDSKIKNNINPKVFSQRNSEKLNILQKISINLNISEDKIINALLIDMPDKYINVENFLKMKNFFIKTIYYVFLDKIKFIFQNYESQKKKINLKTSKKFNILVSRSNLVYESVVLNKLLQSNSITENNEDIIVIEKNVRGVIHSNYMQELKNFLFLRNAINIKTSLKDSNSPHINLNENYINKIVNDIYSFPALLELYENESIGIFKIMEDASILTLFMQHFSDIFYLKDFIELLDSKYIKVKHSFGTFLYDLNELAKETIQWRRVYSSAEDTIYNYLDYKPSYNYTLRLDRSINFFNFLTSQVVYMNYLIKVDKYKFIDVVKDLKLYSVYFFFNNYFNYIINMKEIRENILKNKKYVNSLPRDDYTLFKNFIAKKMRITEYDYSYDNGFILGKNNFNRILDSNKNISNIIFKYNTRMFNYLIVKKVSNSEFSYFKFAINAVRAFVKLTKIYQEKKVFKFTKNLILDVVCEQYEKKMEEIDKIPQFTFDFKYDTLSVILPKLFANMQQLKKLWRNYILDIAYLDKNKIVFANSFNTENLIEERLINFQILFFLFSKKYEFTNFEVLKKNGILHSVFTKNISNEVLNLMRDLYQVFNEFLQENNFKIQNREIINFEKLIIKRNSFQERRKSSLENIDNFTQNYTLKEGTAKEIENFSKNESTSQLNEGLQSVRDYNYSDKDLDLIFNKNVTTRRSDSNVNSMRKEFSFKNVATFNNNADDAVSYKMNTLSSHENNKNDSRLDKFVLNRYTEGKIEHDEAQILQDRQDFQDPQDIKTKELRTEDFYDKENKKINLARLSIAVAPTTNKKDEDENNVQGNGKKISTRVLNPNDFIITSVFSSQDSKDFKEMRELNRINSSLKKFDKEEMEVENPNTGIMNMSFGNITEINNIMEGDQFEKINPNENAKYYLTHKYSSNEDIYYTNGYYTNKDIKIKRIDSLKMNKKQPDVVEYEKEINNNKNQFNDRTKNISLKKNQQRISNVGKHDDNITSSQDKYDENSIRESNILKSKRNMNNSQISNENTNDDQTSNKLLITNEQILDNTGNYNDNITGKQIDQNSLQSKEPNLMKYKRNVNYDKIGNENINGDQTNYNLMIKNNQRLINSGKYLDNLSGNQGVYDEHSINSKEAKSMSLRSKPNIKEDEVRIHNNKEEDMNNNLMIKSKQRVTNTGKFIDDASGNQAIYDENSLQSNESHRIRSKQNMNEEEIRNQINNQDQMSNKMVIKTKQRFTNTDKFIDNVSGYNEKYDGNSLQSNESHSIRSRINVNNYEIRNDNSNSDQINNNLLNKNKQRFTNTDKFMDNVSGNNKKYDENSLQSNESHSMRSRINLDNYEIRNMNNKEEDMNNNLMIKSKQRVTNTGKFIDNASGNQAIYDENSLQSNESHRIRSKQNMNEEEIRNQINNQDQMSNKMVIKTKQRFTNTDKFIDNISGNNEKYDGNSLQSNESHSIRSRINVNNYEIRNDNSNSDQINNNLLNKNKQRLTNCIDNVSGNQDKYDENSLQSKEHNGMRYKQNMNEVEMRNRNSIDDQASINLMITNKQRLTNAGKYIDNISGNHDKYDENSIEYKELNLMKSKPNMKEDEFRNKIDKENHLKNNLQVKNMQRISDNNKYFDNISFKQGQYEENSLQNNELNLMRSRQNNNNFQLENPNYKDDLTKNNLISKSNQGLTNSNHDHYGEISIESKELNLVRSKPKMNDDELRDQINKEDQSKNKLQVKNMQRITERDKYLENVSGNQDQYDENSMQLNELNAINSGQNMNENELRNLNYKDDQTSNTIQAKNRQRLTNTGNSIDNISGDQDKYYENPLQSKELNSIRSKLEMKEDEFRNQINKDDQTSNTIQAKNRQRLTDSGKYIDNISGNQDKYDENSIESKELNLMTSKPNMKEGEFRNQITKDDQTSNTIQAKNRQRLTNTGNSIDNISGSQDKYYENSIESKELKSIRSKLDMKEDEFRNQINKDDQTSNTIQAKNRQRLTNTGNSIDNISGSQDKYYENSIESKELNLMKSKPNMKEGEFRNQINKDDQTSNTIQAKNRQRLTNTGNSIDNISGSQDKYYENSIESKELKSIRSKLEMKEDEFRNQINKDDQTSNTIQAKNRQRLTNTGNSIDNISGSQDKYYENSIESKELKSIRSKLDMKEDEFRNQINKDDESKNNLIIKNQRLSDSGKYLDNVSADNEKYEENSLQNNVFNLMRSRQNDNNFQIENPNFKEDQRNSNLIGKSNQGLTHSGKYKENINANQDKYDDNSLQSKELNAMRSRQNMNEDESRYQINKDDQTSNIQNINSKQRLSNSGKYVDNIFGNQGIYDEDSSQFNELNMMKSKQNMNNYEIINPNHDQTTDNLITKSKQRFTDSDKNLENIRANQSKHYENSLQSKELNLLKYKPNIKQAELRNDNYEDDQTNNNRQIDSKQKLSNSRKNIDNVSDNQAIYNENSLQSKEQNVMKTRQKNNNFQIENPNYKDDETKNSKQVKSKQSLIDSGNNIDNIWANQGICDEESLSNESHLMKSRQINNNYEISNTNYKDDQAKNSLMIKGKQRLSNSGKYLDNISGNQGIYDENSIESNELKLMRSRQNMNNNEIMNQNNKDDQASNIQLKSKQRSIDGGKYIDNIWDNQGIYDENSIQSNEYHLMKSRQNNNNFEISNADYKDDQANNNLISKSKHRLSNSGKYLDNISGNQGNYDEKYIESNELNLMRSRQAKVRENSNERENLQASRIEEESNEILNKKIITVNKQEKQINIPQAEKSSFVITNKDSEYTSLAFSPKKNYYSDKVKKVVVQDINLYQMKELDDKLEILRKELNTLELIEAITASTSQLVISMEELDANENFNINHKKNLNEEFYLEIERDLFNAARNLKNQILN